MGNMAITMNPFVRSALVAALLLSTASSASTLLGTVTDTKSQQPIADVVVTVTSPAMEGEKVVVSDAQGTYRIQDLPPGLYTVRFEKEAFHLYERKDVHLRLDRTVRLNAQLIPEGMDEVAAAAPPTVDIDQTMVCAPVGVEFIKRIAVVRPRHFTRDGVQVDRARAVTPSWMLSRMPVLVPDGTPQWVYRAPSAQRGSPDFGR